MATIYSVTVCDLDVDTDSKKPGKICTFHCSTIESGILSCKIFEGNPLKMYSSHKRLILGHCLLVSQGNEVDEKALFTFDLTAETDYARLGENAVIIDLQNLNIIVRFQNVNGECLKVLINIKN